MDEPKSVGGTFCHLGAKYQYTYIQYIEKKELIEISVVKNYLTTAADGKPILATTGRISHAQMVQQVNALYEQFDARRKAEQAIAADAQDLEELKDVEKLSRKRSGAGNECAAATVQGISWRLEHSKNI